jgi:hypothetical protein
MENVTVIESNKSTQTVGGGISKTVGICWDYTETIEIMYEDDSYHSIKKANIQSIKADDNCLYLIFKDGSYFIFEAD